MQKSASAYPGKLILILGPSGSGKGTIIKYLKETHPEFIFPISYTTRSARPNEKDGEVYHFISKEEFQDKIAQDELLEYAIVHEDNYYGTIKSEILTPLKEGKTVIREVDIQGVESILEILKNQKVYTLFITTPSWEDLEKRIKERAEISDEELEKRENSYKKEIVHKSKCDYLLENEYGKQEDAFAAIDKIIKEISSK